MSTSWDLIRTFLAVAETGSLSAASRRLGLTQPTAGRHIDLLEDALHLTLFTRGREGMALTDAGARLVADAREMKGASDGFARQATGLSEDITGTVRIAANEILGVLVLPRLIAPFMAQNPGIEIEVVVSNSTANLLQRDADIAIRMFRPTQNDLVARKVSEIPLGLFAHRDYIAEHGTPATIADLKHHRFIGFDRETSLIEAAHALGVSFTRADFPFRCDNILSHVEAIRGGIGIGVTHIDLARRWPEVIQVLDQIDLPALDLWVACHSDLRFNKRIRLVTDFLADCLRTPYANTAP